MFSDGRVAIPSVKILIDGWFYAGDVECVGRFSRECARGVLGGVGVDFELEAADGSFVGGDVERNLSVLGCAGAVLRIVRRSRRVKWGGDFTE